MDVRQVREHFDGTDGLPRVNRARPGAGDRPRAGRERRYARPATTTTATTESPARKRVAMASSPFAAITRRTATCGTGMVTGSDCAREAVSTDSRVIRDARRPMVKVEKCMIHLLRSTLATLMSHPRSIWRVCGLGHPFEHLPGHRFESHVSTVACSSSSGTPPSWRRTSENIKSISNLPPRCSKIRSRFQYSTKIMVPPKNVG